MPNKGVRDLINFFREVVQTQKAVNQCKAELLKCKEFSVLGLFRKVADNQQVITIRRLEEYVKHKIACSERELYELFLMFDHSRCGYIIWNDFANEIMHCGKKLKKQRLIEPTREVEYTFLALLSVIIKGSSVLNVWRKELQQINPYVFFQLINKSLIGQISKRQLFQLFFINDEQLNNIDAQILYKSLLRRCYKQLNLQVFCQNMNPLQFGYYQSYKYNLDQTCRFQLQQKAALAKEAQQVQQNFLRERRNREIVSSVHKQAALSRQQQLQKKIQEELRAYQELKFVTMKKYHPHMTFQYFLGLEKENEERNMQMQRERALEEGMREEMYQNKMRKVEALMEIENFNKQKNGLYQSGYEPHLRQFGDKGIGKRDLQKKIKSYAFSRLNEQNLWLKRNIGKARTEIRKML